MLGLEKLEGLSDSVKQYILLNYEIVKLEAINKASAVATSILSSLFIGIALFFFLITLTMGVGFYLSTLLDNYLAGFGIIAGFYLLISIILLVGKKKFLSRPIRNKIISRIMSNNN